MTYTYMVTNKNKTGLCISVTKNLEDRRWQHKFEPKGFVKKYNRKKLVWYESGDDIEENITKEKQLKAWKKKWKEDLIQKENPTWNDLSADGDYFND